ncbi:MAG: DUF72 domain-containing protein [Candidatus Eisenbacteria bacterium]|nr:DUF72 domain-containing protein [Candidatus Eisenbacteria bacterium]
MSPHRQTGELRIGTSGYEYNHWTDVLYPKGLPKKERFACYAERFDTVEINNTFYNLPQEKTFDAWRNRAPGGFRYALKFSRYGTHLKHLKDPEQPIAQFLDRAERLGAHLGPILVQLPPRWNADPARLDTFLKAAPKRHRWAVELRDRSWLNDEVFAVLRRHKAALVLHDMIDNHPRELTADWSYLRFHGTHGRYGGGYSPQALSAWARWIQEQLEAGRDVYVYFNNDVGGHAVRNALDLRRFTSQE